jgi:hypothetical protein
MSGFDLLVKASFDDGAVGERDCGYLDWCKMWKLTSRRLRYSGRELLGTAPQENEYVFEMSSQEFYWPS